MKKRISETFTMILSVLLIFIIVTFIINLFFRDWGFSALASMMLCGGGFYLNQKAVKKDKEDFEQQCGLQYNAIITYIMACMQQPSWAPNITVPTNITSICTLYYPTFNTRSFTTTLIMIPSNRVALTSAQLIQIQQIMNTAFQTGIQNRLIQCRNVKVGFPINNNNEVHVGIEVFV